MQYFKHLLTHLIIVIIATISFFSSEEMEEETM